MKTKAQRDRLVEREYARIAECHRDELRAHSRRILRSADEAEDAVQEALLRGWRALPSFDGRSSLRTWLYRIVTNASLDVARRPVRIVPVDLEELAATGDTRAPAPEPAVEARYLGREDFERALIAAIRRLPAGQRAVLIMREVLGFSARETAGRLGITTAAVNSSLQRARARLGELEGDTAVASSLRDPGLRERLERYADAWERNDVDALVRILAEEARAGI